MAKLVIGWEEWCALPHIKVPALRFKTDTGATFSALHAFNIKTFFEDGKEYAQFNTQPLAIKNGPIIQCVAPVARRKEVRSSNGQKEKRIVIKTAIVLGQKQWNIEITLTDRSKMLYRMLLGRKAMRYMIIKPRASFLLGKIKEPLTTYE